MQPSARVLPRRPANGSRPGRSPGSRIVLLPAPSRPDRPVALAGFVPDYSDGVAAASTAFPGPSWASAGANNAGTVAERPVDRNTCHRANDRLRPRNLTLRRPGGEIGQPR